MPWIQYTATAGQTVFNVPYIFFAPTDLQVYDTPVGTVANDTTNLIAINANYTVTQNFTTYTGTITLTVPATAGDLITIVRNMPNTRTNFYVQGSPITFDTLNYDAEASILQTQQNNYVVNNRMPRYQFTNQPIYTNDILLPILGANQVWAKDPTNTFIEAIELPQGAVILPTAPNHIATFSDTIGTLQSTAGIINGANISGLTWQGNTVTVPYGGTGSTTFTPYAVITAGTSPTGNFQNVVGLGTIGFVLTSTGPGSLPTWQTTGAVTGVSSVTGTAGQIDVTPTTGNVVVSIDPAYVGQTSLTTLGTVTTGHWNASVVPLAYGGTNANLTAVTNGLAYSTATAMAFLATANSGTLITSAGGVPSISQTLPTAVQGNITQLGAQTQALNMNTHQINGVVDPTGAQDAATKNYVDTVAAGLNPAASVTAATTGALTVVYNNGVAGVGATLTNAGAQAIFAIDGQSPAVNTRVLIKNQAAPAQNGIYTVTNIGSAITNWVLTRALDFDTPANMNATGIVPVINGTVNGNTAWLLTSVIAVVGTDAVTFTQFGVSFPVSLANGGTGASLVASNGGIFYSSATAGAILAGTATALQILMSGANTTPAWSTAVYPATTTINQLLYSSAANTITGLATAASAVLTTVASVPTWASELSLALGGTNANLTASNGGIFYSTATAGAILAGTATANQILLSGSSTAPAWSTVTHPATTTINQILYSSANNVIAGLATANSGVLITSSGGVPSISSTLPAAVQANIVATGALAAGSLATGFTAVTVPLGGTGNTTFTAYSVICAGTTATGTMQNVVGLGTAGQVLTSNGASALPSWQGGSAGTGIIFQVQTTTTTTNFSTSSTTLVDVTGLAVTITPSSNSSKILVLCSISSSNSSGGATNQYQLVRGSTSIGQGSSSGSGFQCTAASCEGVQTNWTNSTSINFVDSPATTSATTYKMQMQVTSGTGYVNTAQNNTSAPAYSLMISTITVMEIL